MVFQTFLYNKWNWRIPWVNSLSPSHLPIPFSFSPSAAKPLCLACCKLYTKRACVLGATGPENLRREHDPGNLFSALVLLLRAACMLGVRPLFPPPQLSCGWVLLAPHYPCLLFASLFHSVGPVLTLGPSRWSGLISLFSSQQRINLNSTGSFNSDVDMSGNHWSASLVPEFHVLRITHPHSRRRQTQYKISHFLPLDSSASGSHSLLTFSASHCILPSRLLQSEAFLWKLNQTTHIVLQRAFSSINILLIFPCPCT